VLGKSWYCNRKINWKKNKRSSKHFFAFILDYFSFFLSQTCDGCLRWRELSSKKLLFDFS